MSLLRKLLLGVLLTTGVVTGLAVDTKPAMAIQHYYYVFKTRQEAVDFGEKWHRAGWNYNVYLSRSGWTLHLWK
jgi:hypothetical protein